MDDERYPWDAAASLVWLFPGDNLDEDDFETSCISSPPDENPQSWATFREAVEYASTADGYHGKGAWITVAKRIFNPVDVADAYEQLAIVTPHTLFVIGGETDETISVVQSDVGRSCRLVCTVRDKTHFAEESDFFDALQTIRRHALEPLGLIPFCYGASLKVWPSGMARDMGRGLKAYKIESGLPASELVGIFESGADIIPAKVEMQERYARDWIASLQNASDRPSSLLRRFWRRFTHAMGIRKQP